jgi:hypothetical protein
VNFKIYLILPTALGPGVYSASNRNEYQKHKNNNVSGSEYQKHKNNNVSGSKVRLVRRADKLTAFYEPIV